VTRLIVLVGSPHHLRAEEAEQWLRKEAATLTTAEGVRRAAISPLASPSVRWPNQWGWLIEGDCEGPEGADRAVCDDAWTALLGDLRLLGMRPTVLLVSGDSAPGAVA
jgi:hypothetical protein